MKKIAILGGTFNPIHNGHIYVAIEAKKKLYLDNVIFVPVNIPPHKENKNILSASIRFKMCSIALEKYPFLNLSDIEISRNGISYTYQTLQTLKNFFYEDEIFLIIGADMFMTINSWKRSDKIFELCTICTMPRDNINVNKLKCKSLLLNSLGAKTIILEVESCHVSSTEVRKKILRGQDFSDLVPLRIEGYIKEHGLYK